VVEETGGGGVRSLLLGDFVDVGETVVGMRTVGGGGVLGGVKCFPLIMMTMD